MPSAPPVVAPGVVVQAAGVTVSVHLIRCPVSPADVVDEVQLPVAGDRLADEAAERLERLERAEYGAMFGAGVAAGRR